jgi:SAM-dependent methyltransferase
LDYYEASHQKYNEQTVSIDPASFLSPLVDYLSAGDTVLDVGCGSGRDMKWFRDRGFCPTGFERSAGLAALAREHSGCPVIEGDFETYDFSGMAVDAVVLVGALVHVPHEDFQQVFSRILVALKPEGHVILTMKEGVQDTEASKHRIFYRWLDQYLRKIFRQLNLNGVHFSRQVSKIRETDVWLGYVLRMRRAGSE